MSKEVNICQDINLDKLILSQLQLWKLFFMLHLSLLPKSLSFSLHIIIIIIPISTAPTINIGDSDSQIIVTLLSYKNCLRVK